jgi:hypothetical protein
MVVNDIFDRHILRHGPLAPSIDLHTVYGFRLEDSKISVRKVGRENKISGRDTYLCMDLGGGQITVFSN